jgi:hypothetical protein
MSLADEQVRDRLAELRREYRLGEDRLQDLQQQETALRETLLRISGAIQVLVELLGPTTDAPSTSSVSAGTTGSEGVVGNGVPREPRVLNVP